LIEVNRTNERTQTDLKKDNVYIDLAHYTLNYSAKTDFETTLCRMVQMNVLLRGNSFKT